MGRHLLVFAVKLGYSNPVLKPLGSSFSKARFHVTDLLHWGTHIFTQSSVETGYFLNYSTAAKVCLVLDRNFVNRPLELGIATFDPRFRRRVTSSLFGSRLEILPRVAHKLHQSKSA